MVVKRGGAKCPCGRRGCMEAYAGRMAMEAEARRRHEEGEKTDLFKLMEKHDKPRLTSGIWERALDHGDKLAERTDRPGDRGARHRRRLGRSTCSTPKRSSSAAGSGSASASASWSRSTDGDGQAPLRRRTAARGPGRLARRPGRRDRRLPALLESLTRRRLGRRAVAPAASVFALDARRFLSCCRRTTASTRTAAAATPPVTISLTGEERPSRSIPLEIEPITRAPSSAVQTEPRPPKRLVPAITGPAIASSRSSLPPEFWLTANRREAAMMPPIAAIEPEIVKTAIRTPLTRMPARRAASALPPTAKTWRPKSVRLTTYSMPTTKAEQDQHRQRHAAVGVEDRDGGDHDRRRSTAQAQDLRQRVARRRARRRPAVGSRSRATSAVGDDHDDGDDPADRVGVEDVGEAGDLRVGEVQRAGLAQHLQAARLPRSAARPG